jgi:porin
VRRSFGRQATKKAWWLVFAFLTLELWAVGVRAQENVLSAAAPKNDTPPQEHIFGDWSGLRKELTGEGVDFSLRLVAEPAAVLDGGESRGAEYAQQIEFTSTIDWSKLASLPGFSTHIALINRIGQNVSAEKAGDQLIQAQSVYGGGGGVVVHLVFLYAEETLANNKVSFAFGRLPAGADFATSPLYCTFMNTAICGYPYSLASRVGFTAFPNSTWGARLRMDPVEHLYVQAGIYQVRPDFGGHSGFDWSNSGTTGAYIPVEMGYEPIFGDNLAAHFKVGVTSDTSTYPDFYFDQFGAPLAISGLAPKQHAGRESEYILIDQMIYRMGKANSEGIILFGGYVHSDKRIAQVQEFDFVGISCPSLIAARDGDSMGLSFARVHISEALQHTQQINEALDEPIAMGANAPQSSEIVAEARYDIKLTRGLHLMPDIQYVVRTNATNTYKNPTIVALRLSADF